MRDQWRLTEVIQRGLTLGSGVRPARSHSSTSGGASTEVALAASTKGSLMMLTVNSLVASMFSRLSLGFLFERENETLNNGGLCATYGINISKTLFYQAGEILLPERSN